MCRRTGCAELAVAPDGLCSGHGARQLAARAAADTRADGGGYVPVPVPAWLAEVAGGREAPWRARAACRGMTAAMFPAIDRGHPADYGPALALCGTCPVAGPCRDAGAGERAGVWGGTTPGQRHPRAHRAA